MATDSQKKLFGLMSKFAVETVLGWVSTTYKNPLFGPKIVAGDAFPQIILPFAQEYFNRCAVWIYSRNDEYINNTFDEMLTNNSNLKFDPMDILNNIVMLSLYILQNMNISDVVGDDYINTMSAVRAHLYAVVNRKADLAAHLVGTSGKLSDPVPFGKQVFSFAVDKFVSVNSNDVKLSEL